jgi:hypothetical protein
MSLATRLRKLEQRHKPKFVPRGVHIICGQGDQKQAEIDELIASGKATKDDLFVCLVPGKFIHENGEYF